MYLRFVRVDTYYNYKDHQKHTSCKKAELFTRGSSIKVSTVVVVVVAVYPSHGYIIFKICQNGQEKYNVRT